MEKIDFSVQTVEKSLATLQAKFNHLLELHDNTSQAYHRLANIIDNTRHSIMDWKDCDEQSCIANLKAFNLVK